MEDCRYFAVRNAKIATSWSSDNGETWSKVTLSNVPNNNSGTDAVTMSDGRHILIYNHFSTLPGTPKGPRTPSLRSHIRRWNQLETYSDIRRQPYQPIFLSKHYSGKDGKLHAHLYLASPTIKYTEIDLSKFK